MDTIPHPRALRILVAAFGVGLGAAAAWATAPAGCTGSGCGGCGPACRATWDEKKVRGKPEYSLRCEYACARGRDSWHAPDLDCRCTPPCGAVYVKKRLLKQPGTETVDRVPKYEVVTVPQPCDRGPASCWDMLRGWLGW